MRIQHDGNTLKVTHNDVVIFENLAIPGWDPKPDWRLGWGARTGGATDRHLLRRLNIAEPPTPVPPFDNRREVAVSQMNSLVSSMVFPLTCTEMGWEVYPQGLTELLCRLHRDYAPRRLRVTENGAAFKDQCVNGEVNDERRVAYLREHIRATHAALDQGVPVDAYFAWSLLDNFEWREGYSKRFGLIRVDFDTLRRTPKASAHAYRELIRNSSVNRS